MSRLKHLTLFSICLILAIVIYPGEELSFADSASSYKNARFTLYFGKGTKDQITFLSERQLADFAFKNLDTIYEEYASLFRRDPKNKVTLRFLSPQEFKKYTGAPAWTSAMYFNNEITIPLDPKKGTNLSELGRALRHEYLHAVIAEISGGECPAWLDEGIAQYLEGRINPLLGPALRKWVMKNEAMPLPWLKNGFTLLKDDLVPAAYAQSLFSTRKLINEVGFKGISQYLLLLDQGESEEDAFKEAFKVDQKRFTDSLTKEMRLWARSGKYNP